MSTATDYMQQLVEQFDARGFVILDNTLSEEQVSALNRAVDRYLERFPFATSEWIRSGSASY